MRIVCSPHPAILRDNKKTLEACNKGTSLSLRAPFDIRVHFCLQDRNKIIPPDVIIRKDTFEAQLQSAAETFAADPNNISMKLTGGAAALLDCPVDSARTSNQRAGFILTIPKWMASYEADFGSSAPGILRTLVPWLRGERKRLAQAVLANAKLLSIELVHQASDWNLSHVGVSNVSKYPFTEECRGE